MLYYDHNWRVLAEYDGSNSLQQKFVFGNYIDEVLFMIDSDSTEYAGTPPGTCFATRLSEEFMGKAGGEKGSQAYYLYGENLFRRQRSPMGSAANRSRKRFRDEFLTHDHLHSPAVLLTLGGTIHERYEYDAYGNPTIYTGDGGDGNWFDGDETSGESSALGNPYLFTGRRVDFLDSNDLVLQYSRNRYYDYYSGRWLTQDPLGYKRKAAECLKDFHLNIAGFLGAKNYCEPDGFRCDKGETVLREDRKQKCEKFEWRAE